MAERIAVLRVGAPEASLSRTIGRGEEAIFLAVLVEVWGAGSHRDALAQRLAAGIARVFEQRSGSTTARLQAALEAADRWLARQAPAAGGEAAGPLGAGASVLALRGEEAILAQAGPSVAYAPEVGADPARPPSPARIPRASPWLRRGVAALAADQDWPPLGLPRAPEPGAEPGLPDPPLRLHWAHWWQPGGTAALLTTTAAAPHLSRDLAARLLSAPPADREALAAALPPDTTALLLLQTGPPPPAEPEPLPPELLARRSRASDPARAQPRQAPAEDQTSNAAPPQPESAAPPQPVPAAPSPRHRQEPLPAPARVGAGWPGEPGAAPPGVVPEAREGPEAQDHSEPGGIAWTSFLREVAASALLALAGALRLAEQVGLALLPRREGEGPEGYRHEWIRLLAAATVALPLLVIALAWYLRSLAP